MADNKFSYMDMPLQIGFQFAGPLDKYVQFESMADAETWKDGVLGYEGALVRVKYEVQKNVEGTDAEGNPTTETKTFTKWKVLKVELSETDPTKRIFVPVSDIDVTDGKISNTNINTTVNCAVAGKIVETNAQGFVDHALLNVTANEVSGYGKVVITNKSGLVDPALLGVAGITDVGGSTEAGKLVKLGADGKLPESMIPSVAIGEYLGQFDDFSKYKTDIESGTSKLPETGDTIIIGQDVLICIATELENEDGEKVAISKDNVENYFTTIKSAAGAVTLTEFNAHTSSTVHLQKDERETWNAKLDEVQVTDTDGINLEVVETDNVATITATLNAATTTTIGGVIVGENIDVDDNGVISVAPASTTDYGVIQIGDHLHNNDQGKLSVNVAADEKFGVVKVGENINLLNGVISVATANKDTLGLVQVGENIDVDDNGIISVATAGKNADGDDVLGVVKAGTNVSIENGAVSVATANGTDTLGLVKQGDNVTIKNGAVSVAIANGTDTFGLVKQGTNVSIENGAVSVATAGNKNANGDDVLGVVKAGTNVTIGTDGAVSVATASKNNLGLVRVGDGLDVTDGIISANILWTKEKLTLNNGEVEGANKYYEWTKVCEVKIFDENGGIVYPAEYIVKEGKTRIEFPADFPADNEDAANWTVFVGPAIQ